MSHTDEQLEEIGRLSDATLKEMVMLEYWANRDEIESAQNCLMTAQSNCERLEELLASQDTP